MTEFVNLLELSEKLPQLTANIKKLNDRFMAFLNIETKMQRAKTTKLTTTLTNTCSYRNLKTLFRSKKQHGKYKTVKNKPCNKAKKERSKGKIASFLGLFKKLSSWRIRHKQTIDEDQELIPLDLFDISHEIIQVT